jgi:hypothetical protein
MLAIETRPTARLIPYVRNARTHSGDQIAQIAGSIAEFGFVNPVLVGADDVIIAGHGRVLAAEKLGLAEVPVIVLSHLSESQRRALVIADNRIAENAGWDDAMLKAEIAALHENVFDPNEDVQFGRTASMNLTDALARSNNPVFQVLGRLLGYDRIIKYSSNFGFGAKTGVNYPGESDGFLPEDETNLYASHGDGFGVTAMQLAAFTGAIANGGNLYTPRVPRTVEDAESFRPELKRQIEMTPEDRMRLLSGMIGAVNYGTGRLSFNPLGQVAGKTGTCTGNRDKLGLFTSFSSADNPRVVVTVITTGSTEAGKRAAEIAGRIYAAISPRFFRERMVTPAAATTEIAAPKLGNWQN